MSEGGSVQLLHSYYSIRTTAVRTVSWWGRSGCTHPLCSVRAGPRHCSSVAHILPLSALLFFSFPCSFVHTSVKERFRGCGWLPLSLFQPKVFDFWHKSCRVIVQHVTDWLPKQFLNVIFRAFSSSEWSKIKMFTSSRYCRCVHLLCLWLKLKGVSFVHRPQTSGWMIPKARRAVIATSDQHRGAVPSTCVRWSQLVSMMHIFFSPSYIPKRPNNFKIT